MDAKTFFELCKKEKRINTFAATCQSALETGFWSSTLWKLAYNGAGIKAQQNWRDAGKNYILLSSPEYKDGKLISQSSYFRAYSTPADFITDYADKISVDYPNCKADNLFGYFAGLYKGKWGSWATDPSYFEKLVKMAVKLESELLFAGHLLNAVQYAEKMNYCTDWQLNIIHKEVGVSKNMKIVIDPGHGKPDPGAIGRTITEAEVNLQVAKKLCDELQKRFHACILTRSTDTRIVEKDRNMDLAARPAIANNIDADCFISIHCNSATNLTASGFEIYTTKGQTISDPLATSIFNAWSEVFIEQKKRTDYSDNDPDKEADFTVIKKTRCASVLIELGFISNPTEEKWLKDGAVQTKMATAIANGIERWRFLKG